VAYCSFFVCVVILNLSVALMPDIYIDGIKTFQFFLKSIEMLYIIKKIEMIFLTRSR